MAKNSDYPLTDEPKRIASNDSLSVMSYVLTNMGQASTAELLGKGEGLGEGTPIVAGQQTSFDLAPDEEMYAAAPAADNITFRVLAWKSGGKA